MLTTLICKLSDHKIARNRVWHDRFNYRTKCRRCGKPLIRSRKGWSIYSDDGDTARRRHHAH